MTSEKLRLLVRYGLLIALTAATTMFIHIPAPAANGYFNLGDAMVFVAAILLGKKGGFIAGGIGSALADILLGFSFWAPFTFIIKGLQGFIAGYLLETEFGKKHSLLALLPAAVWMVGGYYIVKVFLYGWGPALKETPLCIIQSGFGAIASTAVCKVLLKTKVMTKAL